MDRRTILQAAVALVMVYAFMVLAPAALSSTGQQLADDTAAFVEDATGAPVPRRPLLFVDSFDVGRWPSLKGAAAVVVTMSSGESRIEFLRPCQYALEVLGLQLRRPWSPDCARKLLHEVLHDDEPSVTALDGWVEHGLVEALAEDFWPAYVWRMTGRRDVLSPFTVHGDAVRVVRVASARATGSPWTSRAARVWRRSVWAMTSRQRIAELERAGFTRAMLELESVKPDL